jgi:hypothetical protein
MASINQIDLIFFSFSEEEAVVCYNIHMYVYLSLHDFFQSGSGSGNKNFSRQQHELELYAS